MIASVVATLEERVRPRQEIIHEISQMPDVEVGEAVASGNRIPITIDSSSPNALEEITRRMQACEGVALVDIVFVHFENEPDESLAPATEGIN